MAPTPSDGGTRPRTTAQAVALGALVAAAGALAIVVLGGVLSLTAGLIVVVAVVGWTVGTTIRVNAGPPAGPGLRSTLAVALALDAVVLGQVGLWAWSLAQGGALGLVEYLVETWGPLVPVEVVVAAVVAWWRAR